ncbi:hypothetical protein ACQY1Y_12855 [Microcystis ichthyoblabe FBCC-A1114]
MSYYDDCFDHITDPVQRNSVRQQWLQMLDGGLSVADVRMLLDKYPDFRFAVEEFVERHGLLLIHQNGLTEVINALPEFKKIVYTELANVSMSRDELTEIAHTFPDLNFIVKPKLEKLDKQEQREKQEAERRRQEAERRRRDINEMYDKFYPEIEQYISRQVDEILERVSGKEGWTAIDNLEYKLYYSWLNFPRDYTDSRTGKKFFLDEEAGKFFYEKLKGKFKDRLGGQGFLHGIDVVANIFSLSHEIKERIRKDIAYNESLMRGVSIGDSYTENIAH